MVISTFQNQPFYRSNYLAKSPNRLKEAAVQKGRRRRGRKSLEAVCAGEVRKALSTAPCEMSEGGQMSRRKHSPETRLAITSARWKSASAVYCANVLRPDLDEVGKCKLANVSLSLGDNQDRTMSKRRITAATVEEMNLPGFDAREFYLRSRPARHCCDRFGDVNCAYGDHPPRAPRVTQTAETCEPVRLSRRRRLGKRVVELHGLDCASWAD